MIPKIHKAFIENTVKILENDARFAGIATGGSYITNEMDEYSDLDLVICIEENSYNEVMSQRKEIAETFGNLLSAFTGEHVGEPRLLICLYGPELLHVDLKFISIKDVSKRVEDPVILFEKDACISNRLKLEKSNFPYPDLQWIEDRFWIWIHYGATKIGRGELFETIDFISFLRQTVIGPLVLMKNEKLPRGVRKLEFDAPESVDLLKETIPTYSKESCIKSLNTIIEMYLELRELFITDDFIKRINGQESSIAYLNNLKNK